MRIGRIAATGTAIALALAGCGGDDGDGTTPTDTGGTATTPDTGGQETADEAATADASGNATDDDGGAAAEGPTVTVADFAYQGGTVTVEAGTTVTWVNEDQVPHTVTSGTPDEATGVFDESLSAGGEATVTVDEPGTYAYFCEVHPNMTAELVVEPSGG